MGKYARLDAAESAFFDRQLEFIHAQSYDIVYADLLGREFVPVKTDAHPGATSVTYRQKDRRGRAKIVSNNAKDIPRVDTLQNEFNRPVREIAAGYGYTIKEIRSAAMAGVNLNADRASDSRRAVEEEMELVALFGSPEDGIADGFLNNPAVPVVAAAAAWSTLLPDAIIADVSAAIQRVINNSKGKEIPSTILLPTVENARIGTLRLTDSSTTVKKFIMEEFEMITQIRGWHQLDAAGPLGMTQMVVYTPDPGKLFQDIPSEWEQLPPQPDHLEFIVDTMASTAGTAIPYPLSVDFTTGI